jgi:ubiquinone/menaquinone biosynthesis C-methylase UbiE
MQASRSPSGHTTAIGLRSSSFAKNAVAQKAQSRSEFDEYARNYHRELDHPLRRIVDSSGDYFIQMKCDELEDVASACGMDRSNSRIVDIGCGIGDFERLLPKGFGHKFTLDLSYEMIRVAKNFVAKGLSKFMQGDALHIPLPNESADLVFASCVMHHIPPADLPDALDEMRRVCKKGGRIVCFEHNPWNPLTQLVVKTTPLDHGAALLSSIQLKALMQQAGMTIVDEKYILFGPKWLDVPLRKVLGKYLKRLPIGGQYFIVATK